jgi:glutamyl-tRNA reductase
MYLSKPVKKMKTRYRKLALVATSVSFTAVRYNNVQDIGNKNILLFGTGKNW